MSSTNPFTRVRVEERARTLAYVVGELRARASVYDTGVSPKPESGTGAAGSGAFTQKAQECRVLANAFEARIRDPGDGRAGPVLLVERAVGRSMIARDIIMLANTVLAYVEQEEHMIEYDERREEHKHLRAMKVVAKNIHGFYAEEARRG